MQYSGPPIYRGTTVLHIPVYRMSVPMFVHVFMFVMLLLLLLLLQKMELSF